MKLPENFYVSTGFVLGDSGVAINRIRIGDELVFGVYSKVYNPEIKNMQVFPSRDVNEGSVLSHKLGMDESVRKLISEIMPRSVKGIAVVNNLRGIVVVITRPPGGITGKDGIIRTVEYVYKFSPEEIPKDMIGKETSNLSIFPLVYEEDVGMYPEDVASTVFEFSNLMRGEIEKINNKRLANLEALFNKVGDALDSIRDDIEWFDNQFREQIDRSCLDGLVFSEYPLLKIQTSLETALVALETHRRN